LPENARFCHRCGKPQFETEPAPPVEAPESRDLVAAPIEPITPSFHHPIAVRIGLFVGSIAAILCLAFPFGFVLWLSAAGFGSVYLFRRRTGQSLTVRGGMRMGWIAGMLSFVIITVLFTISAVVAANRPGGLAAFFREQPNSAGFRSEDLEAVIQVLANPVNQALVYVFFLLFCFTVIAVFCTAGGALGAKVLEKD
jgi:hypothetical protein